MTVAQLKQELKDLVVEHCSNVLSDGSPGNAEDTVGYNTAVNALKEALREVADELW